MPFFLANLSFILLSMLLVLPRLTRHAHRLVTSCDENSLKTLNIGWVI